MNMPIVPKSSSNENDTASPRAGDIKNDAGAIDKQVKFEVERANTKFQTN